MKCHRPSQRIICNMLMLLYVKEKQVIQTSHSHHLLLKILSKCREENLIGNIICICTRACIFNKKEPVPKKMAGDRKNRTAFKMAYTFFSSMYDI